MMLQRVRLVIRDALPKTKIIIRETLPKLRVVVDWGVETFQTTMWHIDHATDRAAVSVGYIISGTHRDIDASMAAVQTAEVYSPAPHIDLETGSVGRFVSIQRVAAHTDIDSSHMSLMATLSISGLHSDVQSDSATAKTVRPVYLSDLTGETLGSIGDADLRLLSAVEL